jgi:hypothetical protein
MFLVDAVEPIPEGLALAEGGPAGDMASSFLR